MPLKDYHHALMDGLWFVGEQLIPPCPAGMHGRRIYIPAQPKLRLWLSKYDTIGTIAHRVLSSGFFFFF